MDRVLIVGLDGATWDLLEPWARAGRLPRLAALMARGAWGTLRSTVPPLTLPAWSSFMTGKNPGAHGVYAFRRPAPDRYAPGGLSNRADLRAATLWDVAGRAGKQVGVISVPPSYPLRPVNGFVVGCMLTPPGEPFTDPPDLAAELGDYQIDLTPPRGLTRAAPDYLDRALPYLEGMLAQTRRRTEATLALMHRPWDLLCVVFYAPDRVQHYFWPSLGPDDGGSPPDAPAVRALLDAGYAAIDDAVGRLVDAAGPGTTVVLVSDHGFGSKPAHAVHVNRWLSERGLLRERPLWRLRRRIARKLVSRARRAALDTVERLVDMARTQAWAQTLEPRTAGIWVNAADRYPLGCVHAGAAYEAVRTAIVDGLGQLRDAAGEPVFAGVWRREELYRGPYVDEAPDVVAVCAPRFGLLYGSLERDVRARTLFGPYEEQGFTGTHAPDGLYLFAGPPIAPLGAHQPYPIESIAPTALHLLGLEVPRDMEGPVCTSLLRPEALAAQPVRYCEPVHEEADPGAGWKSADDEGRVAEHLRALGYLE